VPEVPGVQGVQEVPEVLGVIWPGHLVRDRHAVPLADGLGELLIGRAEVHILAAPRAVPDLVVGGGSEALPGLLTAEFEAAILDAQVFLPCDPPSPDGRLWTRTENVRKVGLTRAELG
jgi:hypothetical protein